MKLVPNAVSTRVARAALQSSKVSPQVLFAAGIVGMGATVVLACRATLKVEETLEKSELRISEVKELHRGNPSTVEARRDKLHVYSFAAWDLTKLYGPAIFCGIASVSALAGSHNILTKRNAALAAAYGAIEKAFAEYRDRVAESYGREREEEIYFNLEACEMDDPEDGRKKIKGKVSRGGSPYAKLFDEFNKNWESTPEYNFLFLKLQQQWANDRLQARGHIFLNEIYDELGLDRTKEGAVVGWIKGDGDGYVDFGIFNEDHEERLLDLMVGREKAIWLDFNVDGVIYNKI